jgi:hypothetical protein
MEMSRRRLYLHAGTHKTGSTSIQAMLEHETALLRDRGIKVVYDHISRQFMRTNCNCVAHAFVRGDLWTISRTLQHAETEFGARNVIDHFRNQLSDERFHTLIVSSEAFCFMRNRDERKALVRELAKFDLHVTPVLFLRDDANWRRSWEAQIAKVPSMQRLREQHPDRFTLLDDWYFNKDALRDFWRSISPDPIFLDYDAEVAEAGSVIPSFLRSLALPPELHSDRYYFNRSPPSARR